MARGCSIYPTSLATVVAARRSPPHFLCSLHRRSMLFLSEQSSYSILEALAAGSAWKSLMNSI
jgi:hypothetical protein